MAVYKIFPSKDTTLYSLYPNKNAGLDSILEIYNSTYYSNPLLISSAEVARTLTAFDTDEIIDIIDNIISGFQWQSNLRLFNANTIGINTNTILYAYPLAEDWSNGTGKIDYSPAIENGASWTWKTFNGGTPWTTSSFAPYVTASFLSTNPGGGTWYTGSPNNLQYEVTQSFNLRSPKDVILNITDIVNSWHSGSINNYGLILKWGSDVEYNQSSSVEPDMNLFSVDTHTIYPPYIEFKWDDYMFNTGSSGLSFVTSSQVVITLPNNKGFFNQGSIETFRLDVRPQYPPRTFQTSSFYIQNYYLPTSSYYAIKDLDTNEFVIDFDTTYTRISADNQGNYFKIFMDGLEPERYYKILVKTIINGETLILDDNYYFKVING
jgi:hypothetical protein